MTTSTADTAPAPGEIPEVSGHLTTISVGLDQSPHSWGALEWATDIAHRAGAKIRIVHALPQHRLEDIRPENPRSRVIGKRLLRSAVRSVHKKDPALTVDTVLTNDPIASYMTTLTRTADLAVIGSRPSGPVRDTLFGHHAARIVAKSSCPVVVWRGQSEARSDAGPVVLGIDDSESSSRAITLAFYLADILATPLTAMHTEAPVHGSAVHSGAAPEDDRLDWLRARTATAAQHHPSVDVHLHCLGSTPEHELRRASSTAQLVVIGSHGCGLLRGTLCRSTVQQLIHSAGGPLLVVP